jgi:putative transposase
MARLFVDVLYHYRSQSKYGLHEFVVMRDHFHALFSVGSKMTVERAVQLIKGGFSYRAARELGFAGDVWQRGFSEVRILTEEQYLAHRNYLRENPIRAGMAARADEYQYSSAYPGYELDLPSFAGAKARASAAGAGGTTKVVP